MRAYSGSLSLSLSLVSPLSVSVSLWRQLVCETKGGIAPRVVFVGEVVRVQAVYTTGWCSATDGQEKSAI